MKVRCVNNIGDWEDTVRLTVGKIYNVEEIRTDGYLIKNDDETLACYYKYRFEVVEEMEKEKVLEVEFQDVFDKVAWRIAYQNEDILKRGEFKDGDIRVRSTGLPVFSGGTLYILGYHRDDDKNVQLISKEEAELIKQKVDAINEKYGIPKKWRAKIGEKYWFIDSLFRVRSISERNSTIYDTRYSCGNYFKTEEESIIKLDKIKPIFIE